MTLITSQGPVNSIQYNNEEKQSTGDSQLSWDNTNGELKINGNSLSSNSIIYSNDLSAYTLVGYIYFLL